MRLAAALLLVLPCALLNSGSVGEQHVHFKIHVPEIINHEVHTKTVFIHVRKPEAPKKAKPEGQPPKTHHKETHRENWNSWDIYGYHDVHSDGKDGRDSPTRTKDRDGPSGRGQIGPLHQFQRDSYLPASEEHDDKPNDYLRNPHGVGYSYPSQYAVHEEIDEKDHANDVEPHAHKYEEGYHRGGESESGRFFSSDLTRFYDDKREEGDRSVETNKLDSKEKTHAGRYFVDDSEYRRDSDERETGKRASRRMLALSSRRHR